MTREETIEWLKAIEEKYIHGGDDDFDAKRKEAISMAIKSLEQEPCGDAISRQAALEICMLWWKGVGDFQHSPIAREMNELPPVTPAEKVGRWIYMGNSEVNGLKICKCSNCEKKTYGSHKFCPNCGAKMQEGE